MTLTFHGFAPSPMRRSGGAHFDTCLIWCATRAMIDRLMRRKRWRIDVQVAYANLGAADEALSGDAPTAFTSIVSTAVGWAH